MFPKASPSAPGRFLAVIIGLFSLFFWTDQGWASSEVKIDLGGKGVATITSDSPGLDPSGNGALGVVVDDGSASSIVFTVSFDVTDGAYELIEPDASETVTVSYGSTDSLSWIIRETAKDSDASDPDKEKKQTLSGSLELHAASYNLYVNDTVDDEEDDIVVMPPEGSDSPPTTPLNIRIDSPKSITVSVSQTNRDGGVSFSKSSVTGSTGDFIVDMEGTDESSGVDKTEIEGLVQTEKGDVEDPDQVTVVSLVVFEVGFGAEKDDDFIEIYDDPGTTKFSKPQWKDNSNPATGNNQDDTDIDYPTGFVSGGSMVVKDVKFKLSVDLSHQDVTIRAKDADGIIDLPETTASFQGNLIFGSDITSTKEFEPDKILALDPMTITWEMSFNGGSWFEAAKTDHQIYVSHQKPEKISKIHHTMIHIGCTEAHEETDKSIALDEIWKRFADLDIERMDGTKLSYWKNWDKTEVGAYSEELLNDDEGHGQCHGFCDLFLDCLLAAGVVMDEMEIRDLKGHFPFLFIDNWSPSNALGREPKIDPNPERAAHFGPAYTNFSLPSAGQPPFDQPKYNWVFEMFRKDDGVEGQTNQNPMAIFNQHYFVMIDGKAYDPSYGKILNVKDVDLGVGGSHYLKYHDFDLAAVGRSEPLVVNESDEVGIDFNGDGDFDDQGVDVIRWTIYPECKTDLNGFITTTK